MAGSILQPFNRFAIEGGTVGRLLAGYSTLEIGLMNCVQVALNDFDGVLKTMFKQQGETRRINKGEALGLARYKALGLDSDFKAAVEAMRHCLKIRNRYAHWIWWDDNSGHLGSRPKQGSFDSMAWSTVMGPSRWIRICFGSTMSNGRRSFRICRRTSLVPSARTIDAF